MACTPLQIADGQRFSCLRCGRCCRGWHVALSPGETAQLRRLWTDRTDASGRDRDPVIRIGDHPYVAHRPGGDCIFLDAATHWCRLHQQHGMRAKPLGCRVYPLTIASSLAGGLSVAARFDCPAVCRNEGKLLSETRTEIGCLADELDIRGTVSAGADGLTPATVRHLAELFRFQVEQNPELNPALLSVALLSVARKLNLLGADILNQPGILAELTAGLTAKAMLEVSSCEPGSIGLMDRILFRLWLADYLRRDDDLLDKPWRHRFARCRHLCLLAVGTGRGYVTLTDLPLGGAAELDALFIGDHGAPVRSDLRFAGTWECYRRFLTTRLQTVQFAGSSFFGEPFFTGLQALLQTYALVLGVARLAALAEGGGQISGRHVHTGVAAIDHAFGRSALLGFRAMRRRESRFTGARYTGLLATLGWD